MIDLDLAEVARARHAYAEAEGLYVRALARLDGAPDGMRLLVVRGLAWVRARTGRVAEALVDFAAALELSRKLGNHEAEVELLLEKATALDWNNDAPAAALAVEEAARRASAVASLAPATRALLLASEGRSQFRRGQWQEASATLHESLHAAEQLGVAGYEPLVISLMLLEVVLPNLGRDAEAFEATERAIALTRARGDMLNLASAINNRRNLLVARKDLGAAIADQRSFMEIGRQLNLRLAEYYAEFNLAELHYQAGDAAAAMPHAHRAAAFEAAGSEIALRPAAGLLHARLLLFQNLLAEARAALLQLQASLDEAKKKNRPAALLTASEDVLASMVELATRDATNEEWAALIARSGKESLEQEPIEVIEMRARDAHRQGQKELAQQTFAEALALATKIPNLLEGRIRRAIASA